MQLVLRGLGSRIKTGYWLQLIHWGLRLYDYLTSAVRRQVTMVYTAAIVLNWEDGIIFIYTCWKGCR